MNKRLETGSYVLKLASPVSIFSLHDSSGDLYHIRRLPDGCKELSVNVVHADNYSSNCDYFISQVEPLKAGGQDIEFASVERFRIRPVKVVYNQYLQGTPARIFTLKYPAIIEVGDKFYTYPKQVRLFILLHEFGHLFYETEWKVDRFALWAFLRLGYNKSQAFYALSMVLSDTPQSHERIGKLFASLNVPL